MAEIKVNVQSSITVSGSKTVYFDPWQLSDGAEKADAVFLTHDHFDHFSPDDIKKITSTETFVIAPEKMISTVVEKTGVSKDRCVSVIQGEEYKVSNIAFETIPAYNMNKPFHPKNDGWCGYVVELDGKRYYVAGDSDDTPEAEKVKCDVLLIPVGGKYTMDVKQASELVGKIKPAVVVPTHYGDVVGNPSDGNEFKKSVNEKYPEINVFVLM